MSPVDSKGELIAEDDVQDIENPKEILGKRMDILIEITNGEVPHRLCKNVYCEYSLMLGNSEIQTYKTPKV